VCCWAIDIYVFLLLLYAYFIFYIFLFLFLFSCYDQDYYWRLGFYMNVSRKKKNEDKEAENSKGGRKNVVGVCMICYCFVCII
jgi:hypothetical protein